VSKETNRVYVSDSESYEVFIGNLTPQKFIESYSEFEDPIDEAVKDFLRNFPYDEPIPDWLEDSLYRYVSNQTESD